jgi:hypothetical protein
VKHQVDIATGLLHGSRISHIALDLLDTPRLQFWIKATGQASNEIAAFHKTLNDSASQKTAAAGDQDSWCLFVVVHSRLLLVTPNR